MPSDSVWQGAGLTDQGLVRASNQDMLAVLNHLRLWVVADGMGGKAGGEVASRLAVDAVTGHIEAQAGQGTDDETLLCQAVEGAQQAVLQEARARPELTGMGTTLVILRISLGPPAHATIAHVGDSRAYCFRKGSLTPLTRDHSLVEEYVQRGVLTAARALTHPMRHVLSRAIGLPPGAPPAVTRYDLQPEDLVMLCTDGLTKMVDDQGIAETLLGAPRSPETVCRSLVKEAIQRGGHDNVTVVVCAGRRELPPRPQTD